MPTQSMKPVIVGNLACLGLCLAAAGAGAQFAPRSVAMSWEESATVVELAVDEETTARCYLLVDLGAQECSIGEVSGSWLTSAGITIESVSCLLNVSAVTLNENSPYSYDVYLRHATCYPQTGLVAVMAFDVTLRPWQFIPAGVGTIRAFPYDPAACTTIALGPAHCTEPATPGTHDAGSLRVVTNTVPNAPREWGSIKALYGN